MSHVVVLILRPPLDGATVISRQTRVTQGIQAGLLAGLAVAVFFFVGDLLRLTPLSTPFALSQTFLGPGGFEFDFPVLSQIITIVAFVGRVLAFTALHFLIFAMLGVGAVSFFDWLRWPLNVGTGALYGLVAYTVAFYASTAVRNVDVVAGVPGFWAVVTANLLAGGIMGGYLRLSRGGRAA